MEEKNKNHLNNSSSDNTAENSSSKFRPYMKYVIFACLLVIAFFSGRIVNEHIIAPVEISQSSMTDTLCEGDVTYVLRVGGFKQFDIIVFHEPKISDHWVIKRVIATEGQEVEIVDNVLYITDNGKTTAYREEYVFGNNITQEKITVPKGCVYLLGDNRSVSFDSEDYGCVSEGAIIGKAIFVKSESAVEIEN